MRRDKLFVRLTAIHHKTSLVIAKRGAHHYSDNCYSNKGVEDKVLTES